MEQKKKMLSKISRGRFGMVLVSELLSVEEAAVKLIRPRLPSNAGPVTAVPTILRCVMAFEMTSNTIFWVDHVSRRLIILNHPCELPVRNESRV